MRALLSQACQTLHTKMDIQKQMLHETKAVVLRLTRIQEIKRQIPSQVPVLVEKLNRIANLCRPLIQVSLLGHRSFASVHMLQ